MSDNLNKINITNDLPHRGTTYYKWETVNNLPKHELIRIQNHINESIDDTVARLTRQHRLQRMHSLINYVIDGKSYEEIRMIYTSPRILDEYLARILTISRILKEP